MSTYWSYKRDTACHGETVEDSTIAVGDMVIVQGGDKPREVWKLARMKEIIVGQDRLVREAVVRVGNSSTSQQPLEIDHSIVKDSQDCSSAVSGHRVGSEEAITISERNEARVNSR